MKSRKQLKRDNYKLRCTVVSFTRLTKAQLMIETAMADGQLPADKREPLRALNLEGRGILTTLITQADALLEMTK